MQQRNAARRRLFRSAPCPRAASARTAAASVLERRTSAAHRRTTTAARASCLLGRSGFSRLSAALRDERRWSPVPCHRFALPQPSGGCPGKWGARRASASSSNGGSRRRLACACGQGLDHSAAWGRRSSRAAGPASRLHGGCDGRGDLAASERQPRWRPASRTSRRSVAATRSRVWTPPSARSPSVPSITIPPGQWQFGSRHDPALSRRICCHRRSR